MVVPLLPAWEGWMLFKDANVKMCLFGWPRIYPGIELLIMGLMSDLKSFKWDFTLQLLKAQTTLTAYSPKLKKKLNYLLQTGKLISSNLKVKKA